MTSERIRADGLSLHAMQAGDLNGPLVLLLHGFPEFWYGWHRQIPALAKAGYRVVALDQRGYNLSDKPAGIEAYSTANLARDVVAVGDTLDAKSFFIVGHDWGGIVAWAIAQLFPESVRGAVILNAPRPQVFRSYALSHLSQMLRSTYVAWFQVPLLPERLLSAGSFAMLERAMRTTARPGTFSTEDFAAYREAWSQPLALTSMINWYRAAVRHSSESRSERIDVPVRVLWGRDDQFLNSELAELSRANCSQTSVRYFDDTTHWIQHERADEVNAELISFFGSLR